MFHLYLVIFRRAGVIVQGFCDLHLPRTDSLTGFQTRTSFNPKCITLNVSSYRHLSNVFFFFLTISLFPPLLYTTLYTVHQMVYCCEIEHLHLQYLLHRKDGINFQLLSNLSACLRIRSLYNALL